MHKTHATFLTANTLKIIAILSMVIDHSAVWLFPNGSFLDMTAHAIGRLAAPIMCYFIAEGFHYTSNVGRYKFRLLLFAIVSHFPFVLYFGLQWWQATSVIWGLLLGLVALAVAQNPDYSLLKKILVVIACCLLAWTADWNYIAVLWILSFGIFRGRFLMQMVSYVVIGAVFYIIPGLLDNGMEIVFRFGMLMAVPLFFFYSGERGRRSALLKWGFYIFYPLHLMILYILRYFVFA